MFQHASKVDDDDGNELSVKLVKLPVFTANHTEFQTWWFHFQAFATVWKFSEAIEQTAEKDLPDTASTELVKDEEPQCKQMLVKRCNAIVFANLMMALDSPSLIGMLICTLMLAWPWGLASTVVNQLFEKYKPHNTVSMIDMNRLKQKIGLPMPDSNPQIMFEQIASLENQFKTPMSNSEKIAIAIEKLPPE